MPDHSEEFDSLKLRIFELQAHVIACNVRIRAFQDIAALVWKEQGRDATLLQPALRELERVRADLALREFADDNPRLASIVKTFLDHEFPSQ